MAPITNNPLPTLDDSGGQLPDIVSNFQDLSALLSLLAADTVEQKLSEPQSHLWERMSTSWCLFGLVGALRAHLKMFVGLENAERAGVRLLGAGGFTRRFTQGARSRCIAGLTPHRDEWQDPHSFPLGFVVASSVTPWRKPHVVVVGYSQCPLQAGAGTREVLMPILWAIAVIVITTAPTLILLDAPFHKISRLETVTISLIMAVSLVSGCITPMLTEYLNPRGAINLASGAKCIGCQQPIAVRDDDTIIAGLTKNFVIWGPGHFEDHGAESHVSGDTSRTQSPVSSKAPSIAEDQRPALSKRSSYKASSQPPAPPSPFSWDWLHIQVKRLIGKDRSEERRLGSADLLIVRAMAGLSSAVILAAYISTYLLLSQNSTATSSKRKYAWIGAQSGILALRFVLWSYRPQILPERRATLLYMVSGSVFTPLDVPEKDDPRHAPQLSMKTPRELPPKKPEECLSTELIHYAAAVAASKRLNENPKAYIDDLRAARLQVLSGKVPLDLLSGAQSYDICHKFRDEGCKYSVVRLPWDFVEELYAAQGVILRSTPWSFGRVHLGIILHSESDEKATFVGFTTMFKEPGSSTTRTPAAGRSQGVSAEDINCVRPCAQSALYLAPNAAHARRPSSARSISSMTPKSYHPAKPIAPSIARFILPDDKHAVTDGDPAVKEYHGSTDHDHKEGSHKHDGFKASVATAWMERKSNGPHSVEFHAQYMTRSGRGFGRISKVVPDLRAGLEFARYTLKQERVKNHGNCTTRCIIPGFEDHDYDGEEAVEREGTSPTTME